MSPFKILVTSVLCAASASVLAQTSMEGIDACQKIKWNAQFLKEHPRAPAGCQGVTTRNGVKYAKFSGTVKAVTGNQATVAMKNVAGTEGTSIMVDTSGNSMVKINGKDIKASDLKVGDNLNFYVKEGEFGAATMDESASKDMSSMKPVVPKAN